MIINPYLVQPSSAYGTLTTAWIAATGETDLTILGALNTLESDLTTYGLTAKMKALYPMVGGTAGKHSYNFMNTAAHQITWSGGLTHSSTGVLPNGVNGLGDLNYTLATSVSTLTPQNNHISFYSRTDNSSGYDIYGAAATNQLGIIAKYTPNGKAYYIVDGTYSPNVANANGNGFYLGAANSSSTTKLFRNGSSIVTGSTAQTSFGGSTGNIKLFTGDGTYGSKECAFASVGTGLSDAEAANLYTAVQAFQTTLGRQVGVPIVSDSDAQAFLNAAVITDTTQATAVNNLVIGLKADSLWTKMAAIYPFVGGNATAHSYNLKNTAQYQITWNGGLTHTSNGVQGNATNGYGDTGLNDNSVLSLNNSHISIYSRTNKDALMSDIGFRDSGVSSGGRIFSKYTGNFYASMHNEDTPIVNSGTSQGLFLSNRVGSTETRNFQNSTLKLLTVNSVTKNNLTAYICGSNSGFPNFLSDRQYAFASIGDGLTDTEAANLYTRVQTYQTALSRNV